MTLLAGRGRTSVPSKILGYMAVCVPVVASCDPDSDSAQLIRDAGCGTVVPPADALAISDALRKLKLDTAACRQAGRNGRAYLEQHLSRESGTKAFLSVISELTVPASNNPS